MTFQTALTTRLTQLPHLMPVPRDIYGIVIPAGGELYNRCAWHLVYALKQLGCRAAIEIWHLPDEADDEWRRLFEGAGCRVVNAGEVAEREGVPVPAGGWQLKPFAVRYCDFAEVMLLDADNCPAVNPWNLFHDIGYTRRHAMFWADLPPEMNRGDWVHRDIWKEFGLPQDTSARPFESGQMIVNRRHCMAELDLTVFLNEWHEHVYQHVYGDKDTFLLAWHMLGSKYHMPPKSPSYRSPAICQPDSSGRLVFQHATQGKQDIADGKAIPSIVNRRFIVDAAAELRHKRSYLLTQNENRGQTMQEATDGEAST